MKPFTHILSGVVLAMLAALPMMGQSRVEYFWDTDPGVGAGQVLQTFTGNEATASVELDVSGLTTGIHHLGLRALNEDHFSATYYRSIYVLPESERVTRIEYSWDVAAAPGKGKALSFTSGRDIDITTKLSVSQLTPGMHTLYLRALTEGHQSSTYSRAFYVTPKSHKVEAVEYFFDTDPGVGRATRLDASITEDSLNMAFDVETEGLTDGIHHIGIRTLTDATWSSTYYRQFLVRSQVDNFITRVEYYWDEDPGEGKAYTVDITPGEEVDVDFLADRLNISRSGLFAKIKTLADVTPNEMIQIVRLKRAAQLLHEGGHLVSEVGYMVGFSNPSYFSKCFQKQFGIRPTDYIKKD